MHFLEICYLNEVVEEDWTTYYLKLLHTTTPFVSFSHDKIPRRKKMPWHVSLTLFFKTLLGKTSVQKWWAFTSIWWCYSSDMSYYILKILINPKLIEHKSMNNFGFLHFNALFRSPSSMAISWSMGFTRAILWSFWFTTE